MIIPVNLNNDVVEYAREIQRGLLTLRQEMYVDVDLSAKYLKKKILEAESENYRYNYLLIVGPKDIEGQTVCLRNGRTREQITVGKGEIIDQLV